MIQASCNAPGHPDHWYVEIDAEKCAIVLDHDRDTHIKVRFGNSIVTTGQTKDLGWQELQLTKQTGKDEHQNQLNHFIECIQTGKIPSPGFADGLKTERVMNAVIRSSQTGLSKKAGS